MTLEVLTNTAKAWKGAADSSCVAMTGSECRCNDHTKITDTPDGTTKLCAKIKKCIPTVKCACTLGAATFVPVNGTGDRVDATDADAKQYCKDKNKCVATGQCLAGTDPEQLATAYGTGKVRTGSADAACTNITAKRCIESTGLSAVADVKVDGTGNVRKSSTDYSCTAFVTASQCV